MCDDRNGVIWFAQGNGITKYDGWKWTSFGPKEFKVGEKGEKKDDLHVLDNPSGEPLLETLRFKRSSNQ